MDDGMQAARERCAGYDGIDARYGLATPSECDLVLHVRTVRDAIIAGLTIDDAGCLFDAVVLLEQLEARVKA